MKKILFCVFMMPFILFARTNGRLNSVDYGNKYELSISSGYGSYYMSGLKNLQNTIISNSEVPLIKTSSFPSYFNYTIRFGFLNDFGSRGFIGGLMSTGSRSSISDYSGYNIIDINCAAWHIGYYNRKPYTNFQFINRPVEVGYMYNSSIQFSSVNMIEKLHLNGYDDLINENSNFNSVGVYSELQFFAAYIFNKNLSLELSTGFGANISTPLYYHDSGDFFELFYSDRFANWSGFRVGLGIISHF